eukprot:s1438_g10.t2
MAPMDGELECRPDREVRLQKLLSSAGYGGGAQLVEGSAQLVEPKTAEVTPSHGEAELPKTKASPRRQPRQFSARPPRPESASRKSAAVCADEAPQAGEEVDAADLVDEPPEAPPELSRTQELLESPCVPSVPSVEQPEDEASCLYDSDDELPCAPPEEAAMQEKQDLLPEQSLELLEASLLSAGSSSLSLSDSVGRRPNMSKAPAEGDEDLSPALAPGESAAQEELSAFLAASLASEGMASSLPEAPEEDCGCARPEARGAAEVEAQKEVASLPESMPAVKEISKIASASNRPKAPRPMRWMTLCVAANWIARTPQVWEGCIIGIASAVLHSKAGSWTGQEGLFTNQELPACGDRGEDRPGHQQTVFRAATQMAEQGHFLLDGPEVVSGLNEACGQPLQHDFSSATACLLKAAVSPSLARSALVSAAEEAVMGCLAGKALLPALLQTPWPLVTLLTMLQQKSAVAQSQPAADEALPKQCSTEAILMSQHVAQRFVMQTLVYLCGCTTRFSHVLRRQKTDVHYPWVQFVARALGPEQLVLPLPWPPNTSFQALKNEALMLLERFAVTNYPGPSNDRETHACSVGLFVSMTPAAFAWPLVQRQGHELSLAWLSFEPTAVPKTASVKLHLRTLCLVCKDGSQDPTTENATNFARTEALREAPELQKFVALFGKTGRVRLSLLLPGGMIGWHPDDGVLENGRLILHVPIMTSRGALTRVGHLLLNVPEGVIHWCDYSLPHSVYNADDEVRVHLIIDVVARDNEERGDFLRNFLDPMEPSLREALRENALPGLPTDPEVSPYSAGPAGTAFARPLARQMSKTFALLIGQELPLLERSIWRQVAEAYLDQAKPQLPRAASRGQGSSVTFEPPLAVVGGGVPRKAATTRRPGSAGRAKPLPSAKALASGAAAERSRERASTRKDCNCRFCPSCRRRLHQENMRQAIARSLETISGESSQEPPIPPSNAHVRDGRDAARRPTPVAQPQRPRSSSANRTPVVRITASSSSWPRFINSMCSSGQNGYVGTRSVHKPALRAAGGACGANLDC